MKFTAGVVLWLQLRFYTSLSLAISIDRSFHMIEDDDVSNHSEIGKIKRYMLGNGQKKINTRWAKNKRRSRTPVSLGWLRAIFNGEIGEASRGSKLVPALFFHPGVKRKLTGNFRF